MMALWMTFMLAAVLAMSVPKIMLVSAAVDNSVGLEPIVCAHHKTGFVLSKHAISTARMVAETWEGPRRSGPCGRQHFPSDLDSLAVGHFIRDPFQAILSGVLYHAAGEEAYWTERPLPTRYNYSRNCINGEALTKCAILPPTHFSVGQLGPSKNAGCPDANNEDFARWCQSVEPTLEEESYAEYLTRMLHTNRTHDAVVAEMIRFEAFERFMWLSTLEICSKAHEMYAYCMHKITDNVAFNSSMTGLFELWSFPSHLMTTLLDRLQVLDYTNISHPVKHSTTREGNIRETLMEDARRADSELFGGRFKQLEQMVQTVCD